MFPPTVFCPCYQRSWQRWSAVTTMPIALKAQKFGSLRPLRLLSEQFLWTLSSLPKGRLKWLKHSNLVKPFKFTSPTLSASAKQPEARTRSWALRRGSPYFRPYPLPGRSTRSLTALNVHTHCLFQSCQKSKMHPKHVWKDLHKETPRLQHRLQRRLASVPASSGLISKPWWSLQDMPSRNFKINTNKLDTIDISKQSWCRMHLAFLIDLAFQIVRLRAAKDMKSCDASSEAKICYMAWRHDIANDDMAGFPLSFTIFVLCLWVLQLSELAVAFVHPMSGSALGSARCHFEAWLHKMLTFSI